MIGDLIIEDVSGLPRSVHDVELAEKVFKLKNTKGHWAVIDQLLQAWSARAPEEVDALQIEIEDHRENLTDKQFGTTAGGHEVDRRFKLVFPRQLMMMIRTIYSPKELPMDEKFMNKFATKYPFFRVSEK